MEVVYPVCCGLDVHKRLLVACLLGTGPEGKPVSQVRKFGTTTGEILALRARLNEIYVRHTGQSLETIATTVERDKFLSPLEAKEFGLIDEVVENRPGRDEPEKGFK